MRLPVLLLFVFAVLGLHAQEGAFMTDQRRYPRVRAALSEKGAKIDDMLAGAGLNKNKLNIIIVAYKAGKELEIYAKDSSGSRYKLLVTYPVCAISGKPGPKRKQGDRQIPEGFYRITHFNPSSNFHLSLGINYPNASDKLKCSAANPGGDIYIHGACVTIGCLPMTNDKIKEIYLLAAFARNSGQASIPVYIFPFRMEDDIFSAYEKRYKNNNQLVDFWHNIKNGYDTFAVKQRELIFSVDKDGNYVL